MGGSVGGGPEGVGARRGGGPKVWGARRGGGPEGVGARRGGGPNLERWGPEGWGPEGVGGPNPEKVRQKLVILKMSVFYTTRNFRQFWADPTFSAVRSTFVAEEEAQSVEILPHRKFWPFLGQPS